MGGRLFNLGRMPAVQYHAIEQELCAYLDNFVGNAFYRIPRYYRQKPDFGDMDIILSAGKLAGGDWQQTKAQLLEDLQITQHKSTGNVFSTVYRGLQVDFFLRQPRYFLSTYNFLSWNDLGNLLGKMFRRFNLKYGEEGLQYVYRRADGHYQQDIEITLDIQRILAFLQLDYETWAAGFDTLDQIYHWVIGSPYFSVAPYLTEDDSNIQRRLRQERTTVVRFVAFLKENNISKNYKHLENKDEYLPMIADFFKDEIDLMAAIRQEQTREREVALVREKFNGKLIMHLFPHLEGKNLGSFIQQFKLQWQSESEFEAWVLQSNAAEIEQHIKDWAKV